MASNQSEFERLLWHKFPVLDDGFVCLVDRMGDDQAVVQAARVSYGAGTKHVSDDRGLIRYLLRHYHSTPFEMAEIKLLVRVPMDCWRQWIRTRTASVNEYSTRFSEAIDSTAKTSPDDWRTQSNSNKQGSGDTLTEWPEGWTYDKRKRTVYGPVTPTAMDPQHRPNWWSAHTDISTPGKFLSYLERRHQEGVVRDYRVALQLGVAREQARKDLPLSTYTEAYWKIDLHNLLHFLRLRMDSHAQLEIRQYATTIGEQIVKPLFPHVWEAFEDFRLHSMTLSRPERNAARMIALNHDSPSFAWSAACGGNGWPLDGKCGERDECFTKLQLLGLIPLTGETT